MFNEKNWGFTLVEVLAVIVIIGFISVITIPSISNTIVESKKATFESQARGIVRSAKYEFKRIEMIGDIPPEITFQFTNGVETSNVADAKLEYDGEKVKNGIVKINDDGEVAFAIYNEEWCATKKHNLNDIVIKAFTTKANCKI